MNRRGVCRRKGNRANYLRRALIVLPIWLFTSTWMWDWWLNPDRSNFLPLFIPLSAALLYEFFILPSSLLYFLLKAKRPKRTTVLKDKKVAVITLCVPSQESLNVIENQLKCMSKIIYPHDDWILDEGSSKHVKRLAKKYGIKYFTRKGISKYNQKEGPFRKKTKAGNVNAWLDHVKRRQYDFFVQLDIDHNPKPRYLHKTLGYFRNNNVAWVQAPSVYKNRNFWTARGAAEQELVLQGPMQMGFYGHSEIPFIIGSHCTYRCSAIYEIGGFQPTRAEDHLDTVTLASRGYKGVYLPEIIAEGDGPDTLQTYLKQQFAWAYSMFQVLIHYSPKLLKTMSWGKRIQFLFAQTWYPFWSLAYFIMFACPVIALFVNKNVAKVAPMTMLIHFGPAFISTFLVWWAARPLMQPKNIFLSWRGVLLHVVRWPIVLKAIFSSALNIKKPYMITPKRGKFSIRPYFDTYAPFLLIGFIDVYAIIFSRVTYKQSATEAQLIYAFINASFMLIICLVDIQILLNRASQHIKITWSYWMKSLTTSAALGITMCFAFAAIIPNSSSIILAMETPKLAIASNVTGNELPASTLEDQLLTLIEKLPTNATDPPDIGISEPNINVYSNQPFINETFVSWFNDKYIAQALLFDIQNGDTPLLSIDPTGQANGQLLLQDIVNGSYDSTLKSLAKTISSTKQIVYIRFAHEMDLANLYPWGAQNPQLFIAAYRHVVQYFRNQGVNNVKWVWSPAGNIGAGAYYPGNRFVNVIGTTILYDKYWYGDFQPTFSEIAQQRVWLEQYNKPVWIVEFGVGNADPIYQQQLITQALNEYKDMGFSALIYLNMVDANIVGPNYTLYNLNEFGDFSYHKLPVIQQTSPIINPQSILKANLKPVNNLNPIKIKGTD